MAQISPASPSSTKLAVNCAWSADEESDDDGNAPPGGRKSYCVPGIASMNRVSSASINRAVFVPFFGFGQIYPQ